MLKNNKKCIICKNPHLIKYLDLGKIALANSCLNKADLKRPELKFPLRVYYCTACHLAQLKDWVDRKMLFEDYAYFTGASQPLHEHFRKYAEQVYKKFPTQTKQFVLDIGSNDGILLKHFQKLGATVLGVDPAKNVARIARRNGIETKALFFNLNVAKNILKKYGHASIITANNILAHTNNLHGIIAGVKKLLSEKGIFIFEVQYLGDLIKKNEFDNTYHEHICYFSLFPLVKLLDIWGLQIFDVERVDTQGGSIRVFAGHKPLLFPVNKRVKKMQDFEEENGLHNLKTYRKFGTVPQKIKKKLLKLLIGLKKQNKKIVGYGAAAKGNTLLQYCGIGTEIIDYIADTTAFKQGKFTPGTHIPILPPEHIKKNLPDYVLILAWNYASSIMKNESWLKNKSVKFIVPIPKITII